MAIGLGKIFGFEFALKTSITPILSIHPGNSLAQVAYFPFHLVQRTMCIFPWGGSPERDLAHIQEPDHRLFFTGLWHGPVGILLFGAYTMCCFSSLSGWAVMPFWIGLPRFLQHIYSLLIIIVGWVFFRAQDLESALHYLCEYVHRQRRGMDRPVYPPEPAAGILPGRSHHLLATRGKGSGTAAARGIRKLFTMAFW